MKFRHWASMAAGALAITGFTTLASADDEAHGQSQTQGHEIEESGGYGAQKGAVGALTEDERMFLDEMAQNNLAEVSLARLAQQKATDPEVKTFAAKMVKDHQKVVDDIKGLGSKIGYTVPNIMSEDSRRLERNLTNLSGAEFDRRFISELANEHENMIEELEDMQKDAQNVDIKNWIGRALPQFKQHLSQVERLEDKVSAAGYGEDIQQQDIESPDTTMPEQQPVLPDEQR